MIFDVSLFTTSQPGAPSKINPLLSKVASCENLATEGERDKFMTFSTGVISSIQDNISLNSTTVSVRRHHHVLRVVLADILEGGPVVSTLKQNSRQIDANASTAPAPPVYHEHLFDRST